MTQFQHFFNAPCDPSANSSVFWLLPAPGVMVRGSPVRFGSMFTASNLASSAGRRSCPSAVKKWISRSWFLNSSSKRISVVFAARSHLTCQNFDPAAMPTCRRDIANPTQHTAKEITAAAPPPDCMTPAISTPWKIMKKLFLWVSCEISNSRCLSASSNARVELPTADSSGELGTFFQVSYQKEIIT